MKKYFLLNNVNSEKGAATVLVLCVILILTALGTVALAASVLNARLSGKVLSWTKEYYSLDTQAERYVQSIDQQLITAENDARTYVQNRYDKKPAIGLPTKFNDDDSYDMDTGAQAFFNGHYQETWTTSDGAVEITLQDYIDDPMVLDKSASYEKDNSLTAEQAFSADVKKYTNELFERVYFFMLSKRLTALADSATTGGAIAVREREAPLTGLCTEKFTNFSSATWDGMAPNDGDIKLAINVSNNRPDDPKEVKAQISVVKPHYETILQTISTPVYGNPIWTNAITASGSITFASGASATVNGDVYASGADGISVGDGSNDVIRGNVYTQGDLAIVGNGGRLWVTNAVTGSSGVSYERKKLIYGNDYFLDTKRFYDITVIDPSLGKWNQFFYPDLTDRDNVYCSSLLVKEGVQEAALKVDGNLWTKDDIQMDGRQSGISIGTTVTSGSSIVPLTSYIGLNPFSTANDPNASSSIINNFPNNDDGTTGSSITIDSNFVVPGVAFYEFDGGPDWLTASPDGKYYYKSAESISARTTSPTAIISAYYYDGTSETPYGTFKNSEDIDLDLITPDKKTGEESGEDSGTNEINKKKEALVSFFGSKGNIRTNIKTELSGPNGYVAGVALLQNKGDMNAQLYASALPETATGTASGILLPNSTQYLAKYSELISANGGINALMAAFDSKAKQLGKAANGSFDDLIDTAVPTSLSEIIKFDTDPPTGERILDLGDSSILEGIVYSEGNLTIRGNGVFKGTIICRGNVTITGNPTVIYDESVIWGKLEMYKSVRDFFAKGNTGGVVGTINDYSSTSGERKVLKRYKILSWQERSPAPGE